MRHNLYWCVAVAIRLALLLKMGSIFAILNISEDKPDAKVFLSLYEGTDNIPFILFSTVRFSTFVNIKFLYDITSFSRICRKYYEIF